MEWQAKRLATVSGKRAQPASVRAARGATMRRRARATVGGGEAGGMMVESRGGGGDVGAEEMAALCEEERVAATLYLSPRSINPAREKPPGTPSFPIRQPPPRHLRSSRPHTWPQSHE